MASESACPVRAGAGRDHDGFRPEAFRKVLPVGLGRQDRRTVARDEHRAGPAGEFGDVVEDASGGEAVEGEPADVTVDVRHSAVLGFEPPGLRQADGRHAAHGDGTEYVAYRGLVHQGGVSADEPAQVQAVPYPAPFWTVDSTVGFTAA
ncbi:hypothetical protein [Streptomyces prunicolor]|uniref:hypothetical protein n=1 Tax=Streptomyces prunicolor TaxID=67348 RepID=UPI0003676A31|nr:hypothetical protein [Streptomyces prunicolor]